MSISPLPFTKLSEDSVVDISNNSVISASWTMAGLHFIDEETNSDARLVHSWLITVTSAPCVWVLPLPFSPAVSIFLILRAAGQWGTCKENFRLRLGL